MIKFKHCELYLYIITIETEMHLHDYCDLDSANFVLHHDEHIVSIYTDETAARRAFVFMRIGDFFNDTQIQYDINFANLNLYRYIVIDENEAEDDKLLTSRSLI